MAEVRSSPRLSTSLPVALRFPDSNPPEGWGRILDISMAGAKLETRRLVKMGESIYLTFSPRQEMRLENLRARVVRVRWEEGYYVCGVVFDDSVDRAYLKEALLVLVAQ